MALRQYHTPDGIITREPTPEELAMEFEMEKNSPHFQRLINVLAELHTKTTQEIEDLFKKHYKG